MFDSFVANAGQYVHANPWLALVAVFVGDILTASNPCVLAMIPLMMSFKSRWIGGLVWHMVERIHRQNQVAVLMADILGACVPQVIPILANRPRAWEHSCAQEEALL
jgi:hypothetical protein